MKYFKELGLLIFLLTFIGSVSVYAECTGCGEEGHEVCIEDPNHTHEASQDHDHVIGIFNDHKHEEVLEASVLPDPEVVFAVCVFADGTLVDHKGADNMSDCLKTKRLVEKDWRNKQDTADTVEINGITYQINGEHLAFMCDLVDARVHHYADGSWEIIEILGKHKKEE
jgi:hypothetical protein